MSIRFYSTVELLELPDTEWLVQDWIPRQRLVTMYGQPGHGKSFVALDIALSVAEGIPWLGKHKTRQGPVIYIAAEGGHSIKRRVKAWMDYNGIKSVEAMQFVLEAFDMKDERAVGEFVEKIEDRDIYPELVIVDTLSRSFGGGEENASTDMGQFVNRIAEVATNRQTAIMAIHHTNVGGARERGHTSLRGGMDVMIKCTAIKDRDHQLKNVIVDNDKQKDDPSAPRIVLERLNVAKSCVLIPSEGRDLPEGVPMLSDVAAKLLSVCWAVEGEKIEKDEWLASVEFSRRTFHRAANELLDKNLVKRQGHGKYMLTGLGLTTREAYDEQSQ